MKLKTHEEALPGMLRTHAKKQMPPLADVSGRLVWEKRREPRYRTNDPAYVEVLNKGALRVPATVLDVSRSGLRIKLHVSVPVHVHVEITIRGSLVLLGEIRYCSLVRGHYHAGVSIRGVISPELAFTRV